MKFKSETERRHYEEDYRPAYDALMEYYPFTLNVIEDEIWKPVVGYEKFYHVSNYGRVKSFQRYRAGKILTPKLNIGGYLFVTLSMSGKTKNFKVHVLVAKAFIPNPDNKPEVNHRIGCKFNCHVSNLEWSTHAENQQHAYDNGLNVAKKGTEHYKTKIKDEEIILYIRENPDNLSRKELAAMFGMKPQHISRIQLGKLWGHVGGTVRKPQKRSPNVTEETKRLIRADWATGNFTQKQLAQKYNLAQSTIWNIIHEEAQ